ncbi:MAG TPA: hypothetical protein VKY90_02245 [Candidatus Dormibacteraeota bacterium]|nr:hypothetical protein [Candidatus Dormibacteraeota bacterium]
MALVGGLALSGLGSVPGIAGAASVPQLSLEVSQRWQLASSQGTWTPYVVTVKNTGQSSFSGDVVLVPEDDRNSDTGTYPVYQTPVEVGRDSTRSVLVYVIDSPDGYRAELHDSSGRVLARASVNPTVRGSTAIGILSDLPQADQKISAPMRALSRVDTTFTRFASPQAFPTSAVYLSGLSGVILDDFDSAALSQAQVQALEDFVGLGGTLIEAGGPSWRRTLLPLPSDLLPMPPQSTATASLGALADLAGMSTDAVAQVATGPTSSRASVVLSSSEGLPLVVEGSYGAGDIVELAFDPFAGPFDSQVDLAGLAWTQAIDRALSGVQGAGHSLFSNGFGSGSAFGGGPSVTGLGSWAPGYSSSADQLVQILQDTPAASSPPVGLLGGLLVAYVLLVGVLSYLFLRAIGRRVLLWATVPAIAVFFTAGAYVVGFGSRGSDYLLTEVQVNRLGPHGAVMSYSFDGIYAPRKGDVDLSLPTNTLVSTAIMAGPFSQGDGGALITIGSHPDVLLSNVPVWAMRGLQTLSVEHPFSYQPGQAMPIEVRLRLQKGRLQGTVINHTSRSLSDVVLVSSNGPQVVLAPDLGPHASTSVDTPFEQNLGALPNARGAPAAVRDASESTKDAVVRLAASQAISGRPGDLAVVALTGASDSLLVDGEQPGRSALAAMVEPVRLQSSDSLLGMAPRPRLVSGISNADGTSQVDVYDLNIPAGLTSTPALSYTFVDSPDPAVQSVEVYDWSTHTWRALPKQQLPLRSQQPVALTPGEVQGNVVRVRVRETLPYQANLSLVDQGSQS